jgi:hypothetical protein
MKSTQPTPIKMTKQVVGLIVILLVMGVILIFGIGARQAKPTTPKGIDTQFDTNAVEKTKGKDTQYPVVVPDPKTLGKPDPFAP